MDFTGGEICAAQEDWDAIVPAPLDSAVMEEEEKRAGCGCLHLLRHLFRRKKKSKRAKSNESKVNVIFESNEMKKDEEEQTVEDDERVTRAIVHVDAVQDEGEEHTAEVQESEEGKRKVATAEVYEGSVTSKEAEDRNEEKEEGKVKGTAGEDLEVATEGWTLVRSKRRMHRKVQALPAVPERKPAVKEQAPRPPQTSATPCRKGKDSPPMPSARPAVPERKPAAKQQAPRAPQARAAPHGKRQKGSGTQRAPNNVRCSWEKVAEAAVPVAPPMRRCIVGPRGTTLRQVHQQFAGVRVTVPPPKDTVTATVRVRGPPRQVAAAVAHLKGLLQEAEVIEARVAVAPHQRRHVVGHRGVTVRELQQQFPDVSVTVPPAGDLESRSVLLRGPRRQVPGAEAFLQARLQAARTDTRHAHTSGRHGHVHTPSRQ